MKWFGGLTRMSIRTKLILGVALVHFVLMTIFVLDLVHRQRAFLLQEATTAALKQSRMTAAAAVSWVLSDDLEGIEEVLQSSAKDTPLRYALIADSEGMVLAHTNHRLVGKYLADQMSLKALKNSGGPHVWHTDRHTIHTMAPILAGQHTIGFVLLGLDTNHTDAHLSYVSRNGFLYMLIAIAAGTLFAFLMAHYILRQLNLILAGVARIGDDQLDCPIPIISDDEIGRVGVALNKSMLRLRHSRSEIERAVDERRRAERDLRHLSQELIGSIEKERKRIGHDLHDELGQIIATLQFDLQSMAEMLPRDSGEALRICSQLPRQAEKMGETIHRIASFLWPATLEHLGLSVAVHSHLKELNQRLPQLNIAFSSNLKNRLDPHVEIVCFRIIQEALANITRHSKARSATVNITTQNGWLDLVVYDDGRGFSPKDENGNLCFKGGGIGILGMRERADSLKGSLYIDSSPDHGCRIVARIPLGVKRATRKGQ